MAAARRPSPAAGNRAVGYLRRSTDRQEQSIPDQKKAVEAYAAEHGLRLVNFYTDDAISGTSALSRRAFQQMIADAQKPERPFSSVVVYDVKRFGRLDNDEAGYYRHLLKQAGVEVRYVSENFNGDATDDLLRPVKQWQARQESKDLSKVTIRGLMSKLDSGGWWMGGTPPFGYDLRYETAEGVFMFALRYLADGSKQVLDAKNEVTRTLARGESLSISKRDRAKLVPSSPDRVELIRRIFRMYTQDGMGFKSIPGALNREGAPTPRGPAWSPIYSGKWTDTTVRAILVNPIYTGDMVWNRRTDGRFHRIEEGRAVERENIHGARLVPNDPTDWVVVRDAHEPLIERRVWELAERVRQDKPTSLEQRGVDPQTQPSGAGGRHGRTWDGQRCRFTLSGLLTCGRCGNRYQGYTRVKGRRRMDGSAVRTRSYACGGYITKGKQVCNLGAIPQEALEEAVIAAVLDFYRPYLQRDGRRKLAEKVREQMGSEASDLGAARDRITEELAGIGRTINNLLDNLTPANRELVDKRLDELQKNRQALQARSEEIDRLSLSQAAVDSVVADAMSFLSGLEFTLKNGLPQEKLVALRRCVEGVHVLDNRGEMRCFRVPAHNLPQVEIIRISRPTIASLTTLTTSHRV